VINVLNLGTLTSERQARIQLDIADRPVNMPFAASIDAYRKWLYVINAGSDDLSVIDLNTGLALAHIPVGANPRGMRLGWDNTVLYVHNMIEGSITVIETRTLEAIETFPISAVPTPVERLIGAQLFNTAADPRMSRDSHVSCANCHFDGQSDGRVWQLSGSPRNTPALYGLRETSPYTWTGVWNDLAELNGWIQDLQAGQGFSDEAHGGSMIDLDLLVSYLLTLETPAVPTFADPALVERGATLFAELDCASCHSGEMGTDGLQHDVGTGGEFDTPALVGLSMSAPYLHDGRATTLRDLFILPGTHQVIGGLSLDDLDNLVAYLLAYP
jgi:YVTN family beta-propeller protein